ncbi:MAG TPA: bifunctional RNase H/acid phosphatase [Actinomycetales bacterium]|nr:bifunctional RNase H/acid phosphatase [Actinomycetales bacterium]
MTRRFVVETDGGSRGNPGPAAFGALVRDAETGQVLAEQAEFLGVVSNNVAEYSGLVAGLRMARTLDPTCTVEVRMDSKLVVEQMSGRWKIKHEDMRRLALEARDVVDPARVTYTWVPRALNKDADRLANEAMDDAAQGRPWRGALPTPATTVEAPIEAPTEAPTEAPAESTAPATTRPAGGRVWSGADVGQPTTLVLLRHGATAHSVHERFSGAGGDDPPLSDDGRRQAELVAEALATRGPVDAVVCSPMARTRQTAQVVADRLGLDVREDSGWRECAFGQWDGLTVGEVGERWPDELAAWQTSTSVAPPGGESFDDVERRVRVARDRLLARHPRQRVLVVTHVTPIKQLVRLAVGAGPQALWRLDSSTGSLTTTRWWSDGGSSLASFNETSHLGG